MTAGETAALLLTTAAARRAPLLKRLAPQLTVETIIALKQRVDDAKLRNARLALEIADVAQAAARLLPGPVAPAWALWARGNALHHLARHQEALRCYRQAETLFRAQVAQATPTDQIDAADLPIVILQVNQAASLLELGDFGAALALIGQARAQCEALGAAAQPYLALLEMNAGVAQRQLGDLSESLAAYTRARALFERQGNPVQIARTDNNRAFALLDMDRFAEAEPLLQQARSALAAAGHAQEVARLDLNLGVLAYRRGRYLESLRRLERAHAGFAAIPNPLEVATVNFWRSSVYRHLDLGEETVALAQAAALAFRQRGMPWYRAAALLNQASGLRRQGQLAQAAAVLLAARRVWQRQGASQRVLELDGERVSLLLTLGKPQAAARLAQRTLARAVWPTLQARMHLLLASCALAARPPALATADGHVGHALRLALEHHLLEELIQAYDRQGQCAELRGDAGAALAAYGLALGATERLRQELAADELQAGLMQDKLPIFERAVRLAHRLPSPAALLLTLGRSSAGPIPSTLVAMTPERLALQTRLADLRQAWHWQQTKREEKLALAADGCAPADDPAAPQTLRQLETEIAAAARRLRVLDAAADAPSARHDDEETASRFLHTLQTRLLPDEALLVYFLADAALHAVVVRSHSVAALHDLVSLAALERGRQAWRFHLEAVAAQAAGPDPLRWAQALLSRFDAFLLRPLLSQLGGVKRLRVLLPPAWHDLPLAACFDGERYACDRWQISFEAALDASPRPAEWRLAGPAVLVGFDDGGRLPQAHREVAAVAAALPATAITIRLVGEQATQAAVRTASRHASLLHLATHAQFRPDNPLFSWLRLTDGRLTVAELYEMQLPGRPLVTLSACETGRGQARGGSLLGMARGFLAAGALGLVVSLWPAADAVVARLMPAFYRCATLADGLCDPAFALQQAQQACATLHPHPFFWAGFVFVNGGR